MGVYSSRDTGMLDSAFVPKQQCEPKMQAQTHQYRQPQYQQQAQLLSPSARMEQSSSQQVGFRPSSKPSNATPLKLPYDHICQNPIEQFSNAVFVQGAPSSLARKRRSPMPQLPPIITSPQAPKLERLPTEPMPSSPPTPRSPAQPTPKMLLERYGIKVRDFAYESKLPPVPSVPRPPPPRDLARRRDYGNWLDGLAPEPMSEEMRRKRLELTMPRPRPGIGRDLQIAKELERRPTEPMIENTKETTAPQDATSNMIMASARGLLPRSRPTNQAIDVHERPFIQRLFPPSQGLSTSHSPHPHQFSQPSEASQPPLVFNSQADSEMDGLETPLITPDASQLDLDMLGVTDSSALPESQVGQMLSDSQLPPREDVSESQMGVIGESQGTNSQNESQAHHTAMGGIASTSPITAHNVPQIAFVALSSSPAASSPVIRVSSLSPSVRRMSSVVSRRSVSSPAASPCISRHPTGFGDIPLRKRSFSSASLSSLSSLSRHSALSRDDSLTTSSYKRRRGPSRENEPVPRLGQELAIDTTGVGNAVGRYNLRHNRRAASGAPLRLPRTPTKLRSQKSLDNGKRIRSQSSAHAAKSKISARPSPKHYGRAGASRKGKNNHAEEITPQSTKPRKRSIRR